MRLLRLNKDRLDLTEFADDVRKGFATGLKGEFSDVFDAIEAKEREKLCEGNDEHGENLEERDEAEYVGPLNDSSCAEESAHTTRDTLSHEIEENAEEADENEEEVSVEGNVAEIPVQHAPEFGVRFNTFLE